jgi:hypothetical protein
MIQPLMLAESWLLALSDGLGLIYWPDSQGLFVDKCFA